MIKIHNLSKIYKKGTHALKGISLEINKNECVGLIGVNGAGKSTLINILANITEKSEGEVYIFNELLSFDSYKYKSKTGFVLEKPPFLEKLTISDYLKFLAYYFAIPENHWEERIRYLIDFFELQEKKDAYLEELSSGTRKKVSIASAFIHQPDLFIMDEPFENLDPLFSKKLKQEIKRLHQHGKTFLISSHILSHLWEICDRMIFLHKGRIIADSTKDEIEKEFLKNQKTDNLEDYFSELIESRGDVF